MVRLSSVNFFARFFCAEPSANGGFVVLLMRRMLSPRVDVIIRTLAYLI